MNARRLAGAGARRLPAPVLRTAGVRPSFGPVVATFDRDDGSQLAALAGYRNSVKETWPMAWWPVKLLLTLSRRHDLPGDAGSLVRELRGARTLPRPLGEYVDAVRHVQRRFADDILETGRAGADGTPILEARPAERELASLVRTYRALARGVCAELRALGFEPRGARALDLGSGSGYLAFALAGEGVRVLGCDSDPEGYVLPAERAAMRALLGGGEVRLEPGDAHALPYQDESFDAVVSGTVGEHLHDFALAMRECKRVLRPGGVMRHAVEPWFAPRGGHALCTLDAPWGHVRLTADEFGRYVDQLRAWEAADARAYRSLGFQRPALTLRASRAAVEAAGLDVLSWREVPLPARDPHRVLASRSLLRECRRLHRDVTRRDLLTGTYTVVARA